MSLSARRASGVTLGCQTLEPFPKLDSASRKCVYCISNMLLSKTDSTFSRTPPLPPFRGLLGQINSLNDSRKIFHFFNARRAVPDGGGGDSNVVSGREKICSKNFSTVFIFLHGKQIRRLSGRRCSEWNFHRLIWCQIMKVDRWPTSNFEKSVKLNSSRKGKFWEKCKIEPS